MSARRDEPSHPGAAGCGSGAKEQLRTHARSCRPCSRPRPALQSRAEVQSKAKQSKAKLLAGAEPYEEAHPPPFLSPAPPGDPPRYPHSLPHLVDPHTPRPQRSLTQRMAITQPIVHPIVHPITHPIVHPIAHPSSSPAARSCSKVVPEAGRSVTAGLRPVVTPLGHLHLKASHYKQEKQNIEAEWRQS